MLRSLRFLGRLLGCWLLLAPAGPVQAQGGLRLTGFLLGVEPQRQLLLRLERFTGAAFKPVDSLRLTTDGEVTLRGRSTEAGLYALAFDRYSRTELVLTPKEQLHFSTTVAQAARQGIYLENSPENVAYYDVLNLIQHYDTLLVRVHETLAGTPDTSQAHAAEERFLERLHRNLNLQLRQRAAKHPGTFATRVLVPLALLPERPEAAALSAGYLSWLRQHYLDTFPFASDLALRHYLGAARVGYFVEALGGADPESRRQAIDQLMVRRQGHDGLNGWLYTTLMRTALARDDVGTALYLHQNYADGCAPALPYALLKQLELVQELQPGQLAPDLTLPDSLGREQPLHAYAARHELTVVYGWVSWCHACQEEGATLAALQERVGAGKLGVYAASLDEKREPWLRAVRQKRTPDWLHVAQLGTVAQNEMARRFHVRQTPKIVLLDRQARIVGIYRSSDDLARAIKN